MLREIPQKLTHLALYICLTLALVACSKPQTPQEVTTNFWQAVESGQPNRVKKHISAKDQITMESLQDVMPISSVSFGKIIIDGDVASVDTKVTLEGDRAIELPISTHLVRENERWAVDYDRTINTIVAAGEVAAVITQFKDIGNAVKEGISRSVEELEKSLPSIEQELSNMEQQIQQAVPQLKSRFENFSRQLEQALAAPLEDLDGPNGENPEKEIPQEDSNTNIGENTENDVDDSGETANPMPKLAEELSNMEKEILKTVPQLKEQIHSFVEQLQEALKLPPEETTEKTESPPEAIEI